MILKMLSITKEKKKINWTLTKSRSFTFQKTPLQKGKDRPQTERKYLQITYMIKKTCI